MNFLPPGILLADRQGAGMTKKGGKEEMKARIGALILAAAFAGSAAIPLTVLAGPGGRMNSQNNQTRTQNTQQIRSQQRLRDGSCPTPGQNAPGTMQKKGNAYGPGDGSGNAGVGPKDGTGYGAPDNR
jgi:hypothetical protein